MLSVFKRQNINGDGNGVETTQSTGGSTKRSKLTHDRQRDYRFHWLEVRDNSAEFREISGISDDLRFRNVGIQGCLRVLCYYCLKCKKHMPKDHPYSDEELRILQRSLDLQGFPFPEWSKNFVKGFGHFAKRFRYDANDQACSLTVTYVRSMRQYFKESHTSIWRISICYDIGENTAVGVWNDLLESDQKRLKLTLDDLAFLRGHPLHLFCAALEAQADFSQKTARKIYKRMYGIEKKVGIARGKDWKKDLVDEKFRQYITGSEEVQNRLLYLQKQHRLLMRFEEFLLSLNDELREISASGSVVRGSKKWLGGATHKRVRECLENLRYKLHNINDNIDSSLKRAEASSTLLNNLMGYQMANAGTLNSKIGTVIALGTFIFLPATAVSTFFSMSMFDFSGGSKQIVSPKFWIFWAVMIPLNIVLLVALYFYIYREQSKSINLKKRRKSKPSSLPQIPQMIVKRWHFGKRPGNQSAARFLGSLILFIFQMLLA